MITKINNKYGEYKIPKKQKSFDEICFPKKYELQIPQKFVPEYIGPKTNNKSVLVFHKIGSGKTCTAIRIGEAWKKHRRVIFVAPASLLGNFRNELRSMCAGNEYLSQKNRDELKKHHPNSKEYKRIIEDSDDKIDKYYDIYSYNKFVDAIKNNDISFRNKIVIIDEVQNVVSEEGSFYKEIYNALSRAPSDLRIVLLSATPIFDNPSEIALTFNLMRIPLQFPTGKEFNKMFIDDKNNVINIDKFKSMITGYVSYYRGAPPYTFPECKIKYVKCIMHDFQYKSYLTVLETEKMEYKNHIREKGFREGEIKKLQNYFFIGTRIISNIAFPNKKINESGLKMLDKRNITLNNLETYSCKFYKIITKLKKLSGTAFVYSNFKGYGGLKSFSKILDAFGYKNYKDHGEGSKRYAVWSGDENLAYREEIKAVFNNANNSSGKKLKLLLISSAGKEGLSLFRCQQVHIIEPYWNISRLQQIIGRAVRYCSHRDMDPEKRLVKVSIYLAVHPKEKETVDQKIVKIAAYKDKPIKQFEKALKEVAVDCELFKNANVFEGEEPIKCNK